MENYKYIMQTVYASKLVNDLMNGWRKAKDHIPSELLTEMFLGGSTVAKIIWNHKTSQPDMYDISDIDLIYFDPIHTTYQQEDIIVSNIKAHMPTDISLKCDTKNQARVHIWHEKHFGKPVEPYQDIIDTLRYATTSIQQIAISLDRKTVLYYNRNANVADDIVNMVVRPNKDAHLPQSYAEKTDKWKSAYPQLAIR